MTEENTHINKLKIIDTLEILYSIVLEYKLLFDNFVLVFFRANDGTIIDKLILSLLGYTNTYSIMTKFDNFERILYYIEDLKLHNLQTTHIVKHLEKYIMILLTFDIKEINIKLFKSLKSTFIDFINLYYETDIKTYNDFICNYMYKVFTYWHMLFQHYIYYNTNTTVYNISTDMPIEVCRLSNSNNIHKLLNFNELFQIIPKINITQIKSIVLDSICCENMYKIPNNIIMFNNLEILHISMRYLRKLPANFDELTKLTNIHINNCHNLSNLNLKLDKFNNIIISFNENIYERFDVNPQLKFTMGILKTNTNLTILHIAPYDYDKYSYYPIRTPTTYLKFINTIYDNLPADLKQLTIITDTLIDETIKSNLSGSKYYDTFNKIIKLTNLPASLEKLHIITNTRDIKELIDLKLPYGCEVVIDNVEVLPHIEYSWDDDNKMIINHTL